jgi:hypothetical protein
MYIITPNGFFIKGGELKDIRDKYTLSLKEGFGKHVKVVDHPYYRHVGSGIVVPRKEFIGVKGVKLLVTPPAIKISSSFLFSHNQKVVLQHIKETFNTYIKEDGVPIRTGCVLSMPTGEGKTYIAGGLISMFKKKALYVVYDEKCLLAVKKTLETHLSCSIGVYYGKKKEDGDVVIGIINSLLLAPKEFFNFGTYIYDEIPKYLTDQRHEIFNKIGHYSIGLMAETGHEKEAIMYDMVGPLLIAQDLPGYDVKEVEFKGRVHVVKHKIDGVKCGEYISVVQTIKTFHKDEALNKLILSWMYELHSRNKSVYVFAETKAYLDHLFFMCPFKKVMLRGGALSEDYADANSADFIFTTYMFGEAALSIAHMDAILYATPRKKATQSLGRVLRRDGDTGSLREIVDIVHSCFWKQFSENRKNIYESKGFNISY